MGLLRALDYEGTGLGPDAQVVEVGWADFDSETHEISNVGSYLCRVDRMPPDTRAVHHIRAEDTRDFPPYDRRCVYEQAMRDGVDGLVAFNIEYEARFLIGSLPLLCAYKAALRQWPDAPSHGCFAILYYLEDEGLATYDGALAALPHRAAADAYATAVILGALYRAGVTGRDLMNWTSEPRVLPRCPIGNHRGKPWAEVDTGFLNWILGKWDMDPDIKWNADRELDRRNGNSQHDHEPHDREGRLI